LAKQNGRQNEEKLGYGGIQITDMCFELLHSRSPGPSLAQNNATRHAVKSFSKKPMLITG